MLDLIELFSLITRCHFIFSIKSFISEIFNEKYEFFENEVFVENFFRFIVKSCEMRQIITWSENNVSSNRKSLDDLRTFCDIFLKKCKERI